MKRQSTELSERSRLLCYARRVFRLPGKKQLQDPVFAAQVIVIDAGKRRQSRPKKRQKQFYSGKKKRHTFKSQLVVDPITKAVICTTFAAGKEHDFHLFKWSQVNLKKQTQSLANKGYQGIQKLHALSRLPKNKTFGEQLSQVDRQVFKILVERYRNRRKRF